MADPENSAGGFSNVGQQGVMILYKMEHFFMQYHATKGIRDVRARWRGQAKRIMARTTIFEMRATHTKYYMAFDAVLVLNSNCVC